MDPHFVTTYAWIIWLALVLVFIIIEVFTVDFIFLMIAIGSIGGLLSSLGGVAWWGQIIIAAAISLLLIFFVRPPLHRALHRGSDPALSNVEALLGSSGTATVGFAGGNGMVKLSNGETWTARLMPAASGTDIEIGDRVVVVAIEGATAVVEPATPVAS
jgi:membrane protein implicated in regulation of membrane protease activity